MRTYHLKQTEKPDSLASELQEYGWRQWPATNRQLKVLRFFGVRIEPGITRGLANRCILGIHGKAGNSERWNKYVFLTNDITDESPDLMPFDPVALEQVTLPPNWHYCSIRTSKAEARSEARARKEERQREKENRRVEFEFRVNRLRALGYSSTGLTETKVEKLFWKVIRPIEDALECTFTNLQSLSPEELLSLQAALARWDDLPTMLNALRIRNPHRWLKREEFAGVIIDIAFRALPEAAFLQLVPKKAKPPKQSLDDALKTRLRPASTLLASTESHSTPEACRPLLGLWKSGGGGGTAAKSERRLARREGKMEWEDSRGGVSEAKAQAGAGRAGGERSEAGTRRQRAERQTRERS